MFTRFFLFLLGCLAALRFNGAIARRQPREDAIFSFTAPLYNISLEENARGTQFAIVDSPDRMGVPLLHLEDVVRFKIVEGDKSNIFKATSKVVGDFVFLRIRQKEKNDQPLNRELKDHYDFVVKATCKRKDSGNLETTVRVHLRITDRNDAFPMFNQEDGYAATISDKTLPHTRFLQLEASDPDIGIHSEMYYYLSEHSADFTVDPISGWMSTLRPVKAGVYKIVAAVEDRTTRLYYFDNDKIQSNWTTPVTITVTETKKQQVKLLVEKKTINSHAVDYDQLAAVIRVEGASFPTHVGLLDDDLKHWFRMNRTKEHWNLFAVAGQAIPAGTNVTVLAGSLTHGEINTTATIRIEFKEEHTLLFNSSKIEFSVEENVPIGFIVGRASAYTGNPKDRTAIRYHLESLDQNVTLPFRISETSGIIRVARHLDFEETKSYEFAIFAKLVGFGEQASVNAEVRVIDSNDHAPTFPAKWTRQHAYAVTDDTEVGTVLLKVTAVDRDSEQNGQISYKLVADFDAPFSINIQTGEVILSSPFPLKQDNWPVSIYAVDAGHPFSRSSSLNIIFYRNGTKIPTKTKAASIVEPPNKSSPFFVSQSTTITVPEDVPLGKVVTRVNATDADVGYSGLVRYTTWDDFFEIDYVTGEVRVAEDLSSLLKTGEGTVRHEIEILASDLGFPSKSEKLKISIDIYDVNNHAPVFDRPWYRVKLPEDTATGTAILQLAASDDDARDNAKISYQFTPTEPEELSIDEKTGKVTLKKMLDRETRDTVSYTIVAADRGNPQQMSFVNLTVVVTDVNDNAPVCAQRFAKVRIPEDFPSTTLVGCVSATDSDLGANGRVRYSLLRNLNEHLPFRIDHHTGCIFLNMPHDHPLDYKIRNSYNLSVEVSDNGDTVLSTNCFFLVELIDMSVNLYPPEFEDVAQEASVYENMRAGTEVLKVTALDPDNKDGQVVYSIVGGDGLGLFSLDSSGVIRTSVSLDREEKSSYWLIVEASDRAPQPLTSILHVFVKVLDKNDHRPYPVSPIYFTSVKENSPQNTVVVKLEASDADEQEGSNLNYKISKGDPQSFFKIDSTSGYLTTSGTRKLDRETQKEHELWVSVCDNGDPQLCSDIIVVVSVEDTNDNAPVFAQPIHHYSVPAGVTGKLIRVFASDADSGLNGQIYYNLTDGDSRFSVDENGYIHVSEPLSGDEVFPILVRATDRGLPAKLTDTRVVLTGVPRTARTGPNRPPVIRNNDDVYHISDADQVGLTVAMVEAGDEDGDTLWWSIAEGNVNETFAIRSDNGALLLAKPIDQLASNLTEIVLLIKVTDQELEAQKKITLKLSRSPVSRPKFSAKHYRTQISEKSPIGSQVYTVKASNPDGTNNKPITYSVFFFEDTSVEDKLRIEPSTGNVIVMETADFESTRDISMVVAARQGSLINLSTLTVSLTDDNDVAPRFVNKEMDVSLGLRTPVGSTVTVLRAVDSDSGINGIVRYSIVSGNEQGMFILESTGILKLAKKLTQDYPEFILTVKAMDGGKHPLMDTAVVRIKTVMSEDEQMRFTRPVYHFSIRETTPVGSVIAILPTEPSGRASFSLEVPCPFFSIHPITGAVSLAKWLKRERVKSLECTVTATASNGKKDTARFIVKPIQVNMHIPVFKKTVYRGVIKENMAAGSPVITLDNTPLIISATDKDSGPNALVAYRALNQDDPYFVVDLVSGAVRSRKPLDFEKLKEWSFYVQASDMGQPSRSSVPVLVTVTVQDENDEPPKFEQSTYKTKILLPLIPKVKIAKVHAVDMDSTTQLKYFLKTNPLGHLFSIDPATGDILYVADNASKLTESQYKLEVGVTDGVHLDTTTVEMEVVKESQLRCGEYAVTVQENTNFTDRPFLTAVTASGARDGSTVVYAPLTVDERFIVNQGTGVVYLAGPGFDREEQPIIHLLILAKTTDHPVQNAHCVVSVTLADLNDNAPAFVNEPYEIVASVTSKPGDKLLSIKAVDHDSGSNGMVQYSSSDIPSQLKLNKHDGKITVAGQLEDNVVYKFNIEATDKGTPSLKSSAQVVVKVVEKARPLFTANKYEASILRKAAVGTQILAVKAISNTNGVLVYSITEGDNSRFFDIDIETGVIKLRKELFTSNNQFNLTVEAKDVTRKNMISQVTVYIKVLGSKDNAPVFDNPIYRASVTETAPIGTVLVTVLAVDKNEGDVVTYSLSGHDSSVAKIDMNTGAITLAKQLNYEEQQKYEMKVVATDKTLLSEEARLLITVLDVNDEVPRFVQPFASADVADTALPGQFITIMSVTDEDTVSSLPSHGVQYSVIDGDDSLFSVDSQTGEVTLVRSIDQEDVLNAEKMLNVSVSDGIFTSYGQLKVSIVVTGQKQPAPRFEQSQYVVGVRENIAVENKSALLIVKAKDGVAPLQYSLGGGKDNKAWPVKIEKSTGKVYQKRSVSRKNNSNYAIPLIVEDKLGRRAFSTLTLNIIDQNDQEPIFVSKKYSCSITAAAKEGDSILMVSATDEDENDSIEYTLVSDSSGLFRLHPKLGILTLGGKVERSVGTTYQLVAKATDIANPPHSATTEIEVTVLSATTAVPKFPNNHFIFDIRENAPVGTVIGKLQQIDSAVEVVRYALVDPSDDFPIMVERASGKLLVRGVLDAEHRDEWRFLVRADSPGGAHSVATVTVRVSGLDDNAPIFQGTYTLQEISEDAPIGSSITVFSVTDPDGPGGVSFSLLENQQKVRIDPESGWLMVAALLDREKEPFYDLTVRATDEAGNHADQAFRLDVLDVNDEMPEFDEKSYSVVIHPERLKVNQPILKMSVRDNDLAPFNQTRLFIKRGNEDGLFAINDTGTLTVSRLPIPEAVNFFNLTVLAFDGKHATTVDVKVNVNHTAPRECQTEELSLEVEENSPVKTVIWKSAEQESNHQLITSEDLPFAITKDGKLKVTGTLDAEKTSQYQFRLMTTMKQSEIECLRKVTISLNEVNDNAPVFTRKEYTATIKENQPATDEERLFVLRVHADDMDSGPFGKVRYSLADGHGIFEIEESSGAITATSPLDREERDQYTLHILASDSDPKKPKNAKCTVKITVADQNDNPPAFERKEYNVQVMESEVIGYKLLTVKALGGDEGETVKYALEDGPHNEFVNLDPATGDIFLNKSLDYEKEKVISVAVIATDSGTPPLSSRTLVSIQVLDENDNLPVFSKNSYRAEVKENSVNGTVVIKIEASDADSEHYGRIELTLLDNTSPFNITKIGEIIVSGPIDYEKVTSYRLTVQARDGGNLTAQVTVNIDILDDNDSPPAFDVCNMTAVVQESVTPGHVVLAMNVRDPDGPQNGGPFKISLKGEGHRSFLVDENMNIVTAAALDHSKKEKFLLTVVAEDKGGLSADCPLTIYVKEESRHPPKIVPLKIRLSLLKGEFKGGLIGKVTARDEDVADMLRYSLVEGSIIGPLATARTSQPTARGPHSFKIDPETASVWAEANIPDGLHAMNVSVTDGKYNTISFVEVEVVSLQQDTLEHAVSIRVLGMSPKDFLSKHASAFRRVFAKYLNVRAENINLVSIQESAEKTNRVIRATPSSLDILFTVSRGIDGVDRGLLKPDHIYNRLKQDLFAIAHESNMKYQLTTEVCTAGQCVRGECRERVELSDQDILVVSVDGTAFVAPAHSRYAECSCPEGFAGARCDVTANPCSRSPCAQHEMCAPDVDSAMGFECICPPGTTGDMCSEPACKNEGRCLEEAEISVSGNGFFELLISNDVETRMDLDIELRLVSSEGVIFGGKGNRDFHSLEVHSGHLEYRWDAGSGEGVVKSKLMIADGQWHRIRISRRGRRTRLNVNDKETEEAWSPAGADVLNLRSAGQILTFGALVQRPNASSFLVKDGVIACFRQIALDGRSLAKTRQGLRLQNAASSCRAIMSNPCSDVPCKNGATCHAIGKSYTCLCSSRYEGTHCEIDRDPCGSNPCPPGIQCIPFHTQNGEYMCKCPNGFTGKHCSSRNIFNTDSEDNNVCEGNPCGTGECITIPRQSMTNAGYICNCTHGLTTNRCDESINNYFGKIQTSEWVVIGVVIVLILICSLILILLCHCMRRMKRDPKYGEHVSVPHMVNPHLASAPSSVPPPLPPRGFRGNKLSNLEQAQLTGLPTVTVRPMERFARGDSRSPSLVGSGKALWKKGSHDYGSAATDVDKMGTYDSKQLEALRRIGVRLDDESSSSGSGPSRVSRADRRDRRAKESLEKLNQDRYPLGDSIQCLPTTIDEPERRWEDDDIGEAVRKERFKLEALTGRVHVGDTVLSPIACDDDYMTMKAPVRKATDSADSQRRPLLSAEERLGSDSPNTVPLPPHRNLFEDNRLYDETYDTTKEKKTAPICDIDDSEAEESL